MIALQRIVAALTIAIDEGHGVLSPSTIKALTAFRVTAQAKLDGYLALVNRDPA